MPRRSWGGATKPRPVSIGVRFRTREDAGRAQTLDVSPGGIAIETPRPLLPGTPLRLQVDVPGWSRPLLTEAEVVWSDTKAMGIAFCPLSADDAQRMKALVVDAGSLVGRLRTALRKRAQPAAASVTGGACVVMCMGDDFLSDVTAELLGLHGVLAFDLEEAAGPSDLVIADGPTLARIPAWGWSRPLILVNVSGPEALAGRFGAVRAAAWIPPPATAPRIVEAVRSALARMPGAPSCQLMPRFDPTGLATSVSAESA